MKQPSRSPPHSWLINHSPRLTARLRCSLHSPSVVNLTEPTVCPGALGRPLPTFVGSSLLVHCLEQWQVAPPRRPGASSSRWLTDRPPRHPVSGQLPTEQETRLSPSRTQRHAPPCPEPRYMPLPVPDPETRPPPSRAQIHAPPVPDPDPPPSSPDPDTLCPSARGCVTSRFCCRLSDERGGDRPQRLNSGGGCRWSRECRS